MVAAGERLKLAIAVENDFNRYNPREQEFTKQWAECRRIVDQFAEDYVVAVQRWRTALTEGLGIEREENSKTGDSSGPFRCFCDRGLRRVGLHALPKLRLPSP